MILAPVLASICFPTLCWSGCEGSCLSGIPVLSWAGRKGPGWEGTPEEDNEEQEVEGGVGWEGMKAIKWTDGMGGVRVTAQ